MKRRIVCNRIGNWYRIIKARNPAAKKEKRKAAVIKKFNGDIIEKVFGVLGENVHYAWCLELEKVKERVSDTEELCLRTFVQTEEKYRLMECSGTVSSKLKNTRTNLENYKNNIAEIILI